MPGPSVLDDGVSYAFLEAFADAWNRHDVDAILSAMTSDCVFQPSAGPDVDGRCFVEVRGCDVFTFREGKIAVKNSYRKHRTG